MFWTVGWGEWLKVGKAQNGDQNPCRCNAPFGIFFVVTPSIVEIPRNTVVNGTHNSVNHTKEWYVAMGVGEMGCNVPSEVVDFDDGFQPEAIVWANPTRLDRAQNPPSTDTSVYKTFVKSPRRLLVFIASHSFFTNYSTRARHICVPAAKEWWQPGGVACNGTIWSRQPRRRVLDPDRLTNVIGFNGGADAGTRTLSNGTDLV